MRSKRLRRAGCGSAARARPRQGGRGLVSRGSPCRPAGHPDPGVGAARHPAPGAPRPSLRLGLPVRRGLPGAGDRRRPRAPLRRRGRDRPAPGRDRPPRRARRARRGRVRRGGMARGRRVESGVKRNIPGRCGNALAGNGNRDGAMAGGTHLTLEERERLAALKAEGLSLRAIARALGRPPSPISRELRRTALPRGGSPPVHAEGCYLDRRQRQAVLERDERLGRFVRGRLPEGWTPEQIAGWLKRGGERGLGRVSVETIYALIHRPGQKGEKLWRLLPRGRAKRGRRRARPPRSPTAGRRSIHARPADVEERKDPGHWEGDLLICKRTRPVLVLKERKTRFVLAARLAGKSAAETVAVLMAVFRRVDPRLRASITFAN